MLRQAIEVATENMEKLYKLSGGIEHDGEKGAFREFFIASLLRPLLPSHFGVGSGVVVSADGRQSRQTDVIIYDQRRLQPIMLAGERGLFPIDSVLAVVEVKSKLTSSHYKSLVDASRYFLPPSMDSQGLPIGTPGKLTGEKGQAQAIWPIFSIFAYTSDAPQKDEIERLQYQSPENFGGIRLIGVLDKGVWNFNENEWTHSLNTQSTWNSVKFIFSLLDRLEFIAGSRGEFQLKDWI